MYTLHRSLHSITILFARQLSPSAHVMSLRSWGLLKSLVRVRYLTTKSNLQWKVLIRPSKTGEVLTVCILEMRWRQTVHNKSIVQTHTGKPQVWMAWRGLQN